MSNKHETAWSGFSASIIGSGHIKRGLPCQDASSAVISPRPALIVCDGRGSASRSQDGASAAVRDFTSQCAVFEPLLATILDADEVDAGRWEQFCRILYRTLMQTKLNLAAEHGVPEKEFDFTVAAAVVGTDWIGCFQVGDGSIVLRQNGIPETAFLPDKGEFTNQTHFLRENGEVKGKFHAKLFSAKENSGIAITSDGPEHLMFNLATMTPGKIFNMFFDDMQSRSLTKQDIMDYLTRREWDKDPRGQDDRSIAILAPEHRQLDAVPQQATPDNAVQRPESDDLKQSNSVKRPPEDNQNKLDSVSEPRAVVHHEDRVTAKTIPDVATDKVEREHNAANHNWLVPGSIACGAIIILFLGMMHYQAELNLMRQELNRISSHLAVVVESKQSSPISDDSGVIQETFSTAQACFVTDDLGQSQINSGISSDGLDESIANENVLAGKTEGGCEQEEQVNDLQHEGEAVESNKEHNTIQVREEYGVSVEYHYPSQE